MDEWKLPPDVKIYEALGAVADGRIELDDNSARVRSSSGAKFYDVHYDRKSRSIMANDNGSYWQGYIGYPAIAYLLRIGDITYDYDVARNLAGFDWKQINTSNKNDWAKTIAQVRTEMKKRNPALDLASVDHAVASIRSALSDMHLSKLGPRTKPPTGD
jgi:hypothetical protein